MKHIRMLADCCGSENGFCVRYFRRAQAYWIAEGLACRLMRDGAAIAIADDNTNSNGENFMTPASRRLLTRVSGPASEPLTLAETKLYLRVDGSEEDALVTDLVSIAREYAESYLKKSLITQSWKLAMDTAFPLTLKLPMGPVQSITSVTWFDEAGAPTIIDDELYMLNAARDAVVFGQEISGSRIELIYEAGYGDAEDVPRSICLGMMAHVAQMYENRGALETAGPVATLLYQPYRELCL